MSALGELRYLLLRAQFGVQATCHKIWRNEVEQLARPVSWFAENYDYICAASPVLVHPTRSVPPHRRTLES